MKTTTKIKGKFTLRRICGYRVGRDARERLFLTLCSILCVIVLVLTSLYSRGYRINMSNSLPHWSYKINAISDKPISRGDYVVVDYLMMEDNPAIKAALERVYLGRLPMVKQVGAVSGDLVSLRDNLLYVNGEDMGAMVVLSADSLGNPLSPFPTPVTLQSGQYWLISNPDRGFDSRYFGWIERKCITHIAYPVF